MPFPKSERIQYEHNPLRIVVCQLRFPTILKIEASLPSDFQDQIRELYPVFNERSSMFDAEIPAEIKEVMSRDMKDVLQHGGRHYDFGSSDGRKTITLNKDFLSLTTSSYVGWEDFLADFKVPLNTFVEIYGPSNFSRTGLRYQNLILRSEIGESEAAWPELVNSRLAGVLSDSDIGSSIDHCLQVAIISLGRGIGLVRLQHGVVTEERTNEPAYLIDSDFYTEATLEVCDVLNRLEGFNDLAGRCFRWSIKRRLHNAMGPVSKSGDTD